MLRRKPTALTITSEDITAFEEAYARKLAYQKYQMTGEDPNGYFTNLQSSVGSGREVNWADQQRQNRAETVDPNDELKPLPGDKARIVRSREERIVGAGGASGR